MGVRLQVITENVKYDLDIKRKYTVIQGNGGTGKTTLANFISVFTLGNLAVRVECDLPVTAAVNGFVDIEDFESFLKRREGVVILDENVLASCEASNIVVTKILKKYELYYILISREAQLFNQVPASVYDMVYLEYDNENNIIRFEKMYKGSSLYKEIKVDCAITEDSKSGAQFIKHYFPEIDVIKAGGRSNLADTIYNNRDKKLFVLYDALSAGFLEAEIWRVSKKCAEGVTLYRPLSFEKYLLDSPLLCNVACDDNGSVEGLEDFYAKSLSRILPHGYNKSKLPVCIRYDCTENIEKGYRYCNECQLKNCNKSKRDLVVYDAFKYLKRR